MVAADGNTVEAEDVADVEGVEATEVVAADVDTVEGADVAAVEGLVALALGRTLRRRGLAVDCSSLRLCHFKLQSSSVPG